MLIKWNFLFSSSTLPVLELLFFWHMERWTDLGFLRVFFLAASPSLSNLLHLLAVSTAWTMRAVYCSHQPLFALFSSWGASAEHPSAWGVCHHHMGSQLPEEPERGPGAPIHPPQQCHSHLACCGGAVAADPSSLTAMELLGARGNCVCSCGDNVHGIIPWAWLILRARTALGSVWNGLLTLPSASGWDTGRQQPQEKVFSQSVEGRISVTVLGASRHAGLQALDVTVDAFSTMYHMHDSEYIVQKKGLYGVLLLKGPEV